eukprot:tig00000383_g24692.t1
MDQLVSSFEGLEGEHLRVCAALSHTQAALAIATHEISELHARLASLQSENKSLLDVLDNQQKTINTSLDFSKEIEQSRAALLAARSQLVAEQRRNEEAEGERERALRDAVAEKEKTAGALREALEALAKAREEAERATRLKDDAERAWREQVEARERALEERTAELQRARGEHEAQATAAEQALVRERMKFEERLMAASSRAEAAVGGGGMGDALRRKVAQQKQEIEALRLQIRALHAAAGRA